MTGTTRIGRAAGLAAALWLATTGWAVDTDGDGVDDSVDNCSQSANADQRDSNADGFGNVCDADLNNDLAVNLVDLVLFKGVFATTDEDADFNGDGAVNLIDLLTVKNRFGQPPGPGAVTGGGFNQRPVLVEYDLDNNGLVDATIDYLYDSEGRLLQQVLLIPGDGTPDLISLPADSPLVRDFAWDSEGLLDFLDQDATDPNEADFLQDYTYVAGRFERLDITVTPPPPLEPQQQYVLFSYVNEQRVLEETFLTDGDVAILVRDNVFDMNGRIDTVTDTSQFGPPGTIALRDYTWNAQDKLTTIVFDFPLGGAAEETQVLTHGPNGLSMRDVSGTFDPDSPFDETYVYDTEGKLRRIETDAGAGGGIDAVTNVTWETGPCQVFYLPDGIPAGGNDGDPASAVGDLFSLCAP